MRAAPLRKVINRFTNDNGVRREQLECGHEIGQAQDMYGDRYPVRRRCRKCLKEMCSDCYKFGGREHCDLGHHHWSDYSLVVCNSVQSMK